MLQPNRHRFHLGHPLAKSRWILNKKTLPETSSLAKLQIPGSLIYEHAETSILARDTSSASNRTKSARSEATRAATSSRRPVPYASHRRPPRCLAVLREPPSGRRMRAVVGRPARATTGPPCASHRRARLASCVSQRRAAACEQLPAALSDRQAFLAR